MKSKLLIAATLTLAMASATSQAQEPDDPANPIRDVCQDQLVTCVVFAVPLSLAAGAAALYAVGEAYDAACGGLVPPGEWGVETVGVRPAYPGQYYCPIVTAQPVPSPS